MAMYYYARKIQRAAAKKAKTPNSPTTTTTHQQQHHQQQQQQQQSTSTDVSAAAAAACLAATTLSNGLIPNTTTINQSANSNSSPSISSSSTGPSTNPFPTNTTVISPLVTVTDNLNSSITNGARSTSSCPKIQSVENNFVNGLSFQNNTLISGTLEALIQHLVPKASYYPDRAYIFAFLLSSRLHIHPSEVLGNVFSPVLSPSTSSQSLKYKTPDEIKVASLMVQLLGEWTEMFPYDFRDEKMMAHVRTFTEHCVSHFRHVKDEVSELLTSLLGRLETLERYEVFIQRLSTEANLISPLTSPSILTICPTPLVLAQQLAHIEIERLGHISAEEFLHGFPQENNAAAQIESSSSTSTSSTKSSRDPTKKTRNLEAYLQWHYRLTFYVATEVCKVSKRKVRTRVIEHWIETAGECYNIGNFNSLMGIIMGLSMSPVERLKKTWSNVRRVQLTRLEEQMSPSKNYESYRSLFQNSLVRTPAATERHQVLIPLLPLFLKDVSVTIEECATKLFNGQINFAKFWQLAKQVTEFIGSQQHKTCPYPKVQSVISLLQSFQIFTEPVLLNMSYELEGPNTPEEKAQWKSLQEATTSSSSNNKINGSNGHKTNGTSTSTSSSVTS